MLILALIEDNEKIGNLLQQALFDEWYTCDRHTSVEAIDQKKFLTYHIFLVDVMLPWEDGIHFAERVREKSKAGIIFLTAKSTIDDKEQWFNAWADDYITKPFKTKELFMRIDALAQRLEPTVFFQIKNVLIDWENRLITKDQKIIHLTPTEREIVWCLLRSKWIVCLRANLIEHVWWIDELFGMNRSLDVAIANIRKKLWKQFIETIPWVGYKLWKK